MTYINLQLQVDRRAKREKFQQKTTLAGGANALPLLVLLLRRFLTASLEAQGEDSLCKRLPRGAQKVLVLFLPREGKRHDHAAGDVEAMRAEETADRAANRISVIIVTWNSPSVLKNCLDSITKVYGTQLEIVVVDNGNSSETRSVVNAHADVIYVASLNNVGFAGGNNIGIKYATREYILLLNDDTVFHGDSLSVLVAFLDAHKKVGVVQGTMNVPAWNNGLDDCGTGMTLLGLQRHYHFKEPTATTQLHPRKAFSVKGAMMMFRREIIKDVGGFLFYDHFFNYYEETDFCHRANIAGWECWFVPTLPIDHLCGQTSGRLKRDDVWVRYIANILYSFRRNFGFWRKITTLPIFSMGVFLCRPRQYVQAIKLNATRR